MKILVDTPIWSYALRTHNTEFQAEVHEITTLIREQRALMLGPIRQELLSGYSDMGKFKRLKEKLSYFENTPIIDSDYELAAELCNKCRKKGIQGSHIDFLICAVAKRLDVPIFTTDKDFSHYESIVSIKLHRKIN
ncbi:MAG: PIN domain-containing protein [Desulfobacterales bacterium]